MNVDDLLDPLRYENLREFTAANLEAIGGGVFTERDTLEHLRMLDLIAKAYQSVHLPTHGQPIPGSTNVATAVQTDSQTEQTLITAVNNETLEILSISGTYSGVSSGISAGMLEIYNLNTLTTVPFMDLPNIEDIIDDFGPIAYGHVMETYPGKIVNTPSKLLITGGESLSIKTKSAPNSNITWSVLYRKVSQ